MDRDTYLHELLANNRCRLCEQLCDDSTPYTRDGEGLLHFACMSKPGPGQRPETTGTPVDE